MIVIHVHVHVKPEAVEEFVAATIENARNSVQEPGIARFDVIQQQAVPTHFVLVEIYRDAEAIDRHKETAHYLAWRDAVADLMVKPRTRVIYESVFPDEEGWG